MRTRSVQPAARCAARRRVPSTSALVSCLAACVALAGIAAVACGGSSGGDQPSSAGVSTQSSGVKVAIASTDLTVGPDRFLVAVTGVEGDTEITGARLHLRFFFIDPAAGNRKTYKNEIEAVPIEVSSPYSHTHQDGSLVAHQAGPTNIHLANVAFDAAGEWVVEVKGDVADRPLGVVELGFSVSTSSRIPAMGQAAPPSLQPVLSDVPDISEIDFSQPPNPRLHELTIAEAVASGRPAVIAFATAATCAATACGPMKEIVDALWEAYGDQANFIHVEPYAKGPVGSDARVLPWISDEWGIRTAPWVFVVDGRGLIAAKLQVLAGSSELEAALITLLTPATGG